MVIFAGNGNTYNHDPFIETLRAVLIDDRSWLRRHQVGDAVRSRFNRSLRPSAAVFPEDCVIIKHVNRSNSQTIAYNYRKCFFDLLLDVRAGCAPFSRIEELHVFTHSAGVGLFLGYRDPGTSTHRGRTATQIDSMIQPYVSRGRPIPPSVKQRAFDLARDEEIGAIFSDHLILPDEPVADRRVDPAGQSLRQALRGVFAPNAFIKLWGCNSLSYGEFADSGMPWGVFAWFNNTSPSVGSAMANYFGVKVIGADRGSNIQTWDRGQWTEANYRSTRAHRFNPQQNGTYRTVHPRPSARRSSGSV